MSVPRSRPARLFVTEKQKRFELVIASTPELPVIDWSGVGQVGPTVVGQGSWGSAVYDAYRLYTSFNGALAAWATPVGSA